MACGDDREFHSRSIPNLFLAVCGRSGEPFTELTKLAQIRDKVRVSRLRLRLRLRLRFRLRSAGVEPNPLCGDDRESHSRSIPNLFLAVCGRSGEPFTELTKLAQIRDKVRVSRLRLRLRLAG